MKVGILTFHWSNNYGALLQAYALCEAIKSLGHEVRVINYVPPGNALRWWQGWGIHCGTPSLTLKRLRFDSFRHRYLSLTPLCRTLHQLRSVAEECDAVIAGSDQVWNGHIVLRKDMSYFLGFVEKQHCRRVSYAASFGEPNQPSQVISEAGPLLRRFDNISVRDEMSAVIVREISGRNTEIVADPSLLHDYRDIAAATLDGRDYIAVYFISQAHLYLGRDIVREVRSQLGLPVVTLSSDRGALNADRTILSTGPLEWLSVLKGANVICTDSFHGTAVALKLAKPFIAWRGLRPGRLQSLLGACGSQERLVDASKLATIESLLSTTIDYDATLASLSPLISHSFAFLKHALAP